MDMAFHMVDINGNPLPFTLVNLCFWLVFHKLHGTIALFHAELAETAGGRYFNRAILFCHGTKGTNRH